MSAVLLQPPGSRGQPTSSATLSWLTPWAEALVCPQTFGQVVAVRKSPSISTSESWLSTVASTVVLAVSRTMCISGTTPRDLGGADQRDRVEQLASHPVQTDRP